MCAHPHRSWPLEARICSEDRQQFLLQAAGLGQRAKVPQQPHPQDHRVDVAFLPPAALEVEAWTVTVSVERLARGRHGISGEGARGG